MNTDPGPLVSPAQATIFTLTFEAICFTDDNELSDCEITENEAAGFNEVSLAQGSFPNHVLGVLRGHFAEDDGQGDSDIRVFAHIEMLVSAMSAKEARNLPVPLHLLAQLSDMMGAGHSFSLDSTTWELTELNAYTPDNLDCCNTGEIDA